MNSPPQLVRKQLPDMEKVMRESNLVMKNDLVLVNKVFRAFPHLNIRDDIQRELRHDCIIRDDEMLPVDIVAGILQWAIADAP